MLLRIGEVLDKEAARYQPTGNTPCSHRTLGRLIFILGLDEARFTMFIPFHVVV
jgi:hypothetical protein